MVKMTRQPVSRRFFNHLSADFFLGFGPSHTPYGFYLLLPALKLKEFGRVQALLDQFGFEFRRSTSFFPFLGLNVFEASTGSFSTLFDFFSKIDVISGNRFVVLAIHIGLNFCSVSFFFNKMGFGGILWPSASLPLLSLLVFLRISFLNSINANISSIARLLAFEKNKNK